MKNKTPARHEEPILVDYRSIQPETLRRLIEDFVTGSGTDSGATEVSLDRRVADVLAQLRSGEAIVSFDAKAGSATIIPAGKNRAG